MQTLVTKEGYLNSTFKIQGLKSRYNSQRVVQLMKNLQYFLKSQHRPRNIIVQIIPKVGL